MRSFLTDFEVVCKEPPSYDDALPMPPTFPEEAEPPPYHPTEVTELTVHD